MSYQEGFKDGQLFQKDVIVNSLNNLSDKEWDKGNEGFAKWLSDIADRIEDNSL
jgi:hypothetical protein